MRLIVVKAHPTELDFPFKTLQTLAPGLSNLGCSSINSNTLLDAPFACKRVVDAAHTPDRVYNNAKAVRNAPNSPSHLAGWTALDVNNSTPNATAPTNSIYGEEMACVRTLRLT
jgi:hypothetical protein